MVYTIAFFCSVTSGSSDRPRKEGCHGGGVYSFFPCLLRCARKRKQANCSDTFSVLGYGSKNLEGDAIEGEHCKCSGLAIEVAIYRMGNWPGAKIPEKWERKWKMAPRLNGWKMATKMEKVAKIRPNPIFGCIFLPFDCHFSAISGLGPFPFSFPFFRDFAPGPFPIL